MKRCLWRLSGLVGVLFVAACGSGDGTIAAPVPRVPAELVPSDVADGTLKFYPKADEPTAQAFANAGDRSLQADAKLWELRQGDRLVGALQITTVVDKLDLARADDRDSLLRQIMLGTVDQLEVGEVPVWATAANDKVVYLWFSKGIFQVLQLKGSELEPERVLTDVLSFQTQSKAWKPLPPEAYDDA